MKGLKKELKAMWNDESAQGMVEYILILAAVIGFVMLLRRRMGESLNQGLDKVGTGINQFEVGEP